MAYHTVATGDSPLAGRRTAKGDDEASAALLRLALRGRHGRVPGRRCRRGRPVLALLQGPARLLDAAGLRAAGDDPRARAPTARCSPNTRASGGSSCRSRRCRSWSSTPSSRPRTRISTSMAASTSSGIARAGLLYVQNFGTGRRPQGASTITQQVAKNFLLTNEVSFNRKIKEALLALKIERTYSKEKILELYLNEIFLGLGAYGIAAASLLYFDKSVHELTIAEAAYLAALPKGPNNYHPFRQPRRAIERRNYVIDRMVEDGYIKRAGRREGEEGAAQRHAAPDRRAHLRCRVLRRGSAPRAQRQIRREEALRGRAVGAHHARSQAAGDGPQGAGRRPGQVRRGAGLSRRGRQDRSSRATGASSSPT